MAIITGTNTGSKAIDITHRILNGGKKHIQIPVGAFSVTVDDTSLSYVEQQLDANSSAITYTIQAGGTPTVSMTIAAETSGHRITTIQLKDAQGNNVEEAMPITVWVADSATGGLTAQSTLTTTITSGTTLDALVANKLYSLVTTAAGAAAVQIADTGKTYYLIVQIAGSSPIASAAIVLT